MNVITRVGPKGTYLVKENDCVLWEMRTNGNIVRRTLLKDVSGNAIKTNVIAVGPGCAMAADSLGSLLTVGVLGEQITERSVAVISTANEMEPNVVARNQIHRFIIKELTPFRDNTFVLVGGTGHDGLCLQMDNQGKIIREEEFDIGQMETFTGVDWVKSDNSSLAVVGLSVEDGNATEWPGKNFILLCDPNCKIIHEDYFMGWKTISPLLLVPSQPKVCHLDNGNVIVLYNKESTDSKRWLWARCYTQELRLLWEKAIFSSDKSPYKLPFYFDVTSRGSKGGFAVGILTPLKGLKFLFFNEDGSKIGLTEYRGMVTNRGFYLMQIRGRTIAVFEEASGPGSLKEISIKAKVIALD